MIGTSLELPCGVTLKNRVAKAAMTENIADEHSRATPRHNKLYQTWAVGGSGLLITGNVQVDRRYLERPGNICIDGPQDSASMTALSELAASGSANGTQLWVQLGHAGRQATAKVNSIPVGPSAVPLQGIPKLAIGHPRALSKDEVQSLPAKFAAAAKACQAAGFGGVQVHSAHGYLLSSFLNPRANLRSDEYGGSLENRARPLLEVMRAVRSAVGPNFGVGVKLNSADFQKGGFSHEDAIEVARMLGSEKGLVDLLELSGGNYEAPVMCSNKKSVEAGSGGDGAQGDEQGRSAIQESTQLREAYYLLYCRDVRAALRRDGSSLLLMLTGGFRSLKAMNAALKDGDCDVVGLGRPLCGSPNCVNDLLQAAAAAVSKNNNDGDNGREDGGDFTLPCYEDNLTPFPAVLRAILSSFKLGRTVCFFATQAWYYENLYRLADGGIDIGDVSKIGCGAAMLVNEREEGRKASALAGNLQCQGTHYRGPQRGGKEGNLTRYLFSLGALGLVGGLVAYLW